ncbi:TRAP transporter small permease [Aurantimonas sp. HBX-1]|uniref:TRAP transporter small permease n=1 Tax=Aurantimonas sp. HBX-1 TaxID=2906072 RepID=UPI001F161F48|nr:TRAP transporter small permease [Aurantimonas sp. HBX-1]UIJ71033.1 TRAP transporter small permease [Aurantimonas sp. HBX-1]
MLAVPIRIVDQFSRFLQIIGQVILASMVLTITYDATMRYAFASPTSWSLEVNSFLLVYVAIMTAADVERRGEHIGITFLTEGFGEAGRRAVAVLVGLTGAAFCGILTWRGYLMAHDAWSYGERVSSAFGTPMWIPYAMLPIGFGALGLQFLLNMFREQPVGVGGADHV